MRGFIWKQFIKFKVCIIGFILFYIFTYGFPILFIEAGMSGFELLQMVARFNYYACFFLVCVSYYYISAADRNAVREASEVGGCRAIYEKNAFACMFVQTLIWNLGMCILLVLCCLKNDGTNYFLTWFPENYLYNIFIPQIICLLFTFLVCASWNSQIWFFVEFLFLFLISPLAENIIWPEKPAIPIDLIWQKLSWPFRILYQNGEWSPDYQNDLQLEPVRIYVLLFWLTFLIGMTIIYVWRKRKIGTVVAAVSVFLLILSYQPASLYRLNSSWNGQNIDRVELNQSNEMTVSNEEEVDFTVTDYDLELSMKSELEVKGRLVLQAPLESQQFCMTLYRGYSVKKVESETEGVMVTFEQQKDDLILKTSKPVRQLTVLIQYKGHHNKFYSNARAAMLPGWFPWYPMAGRRQIMLKYQIYGYNCYNRIESAHIRIKTNYPVITNLSEKEMNCYEGESDSITVLGGNMKRTEDERIINYFPLNLYSDSENNYDAFLEREKQAYTKALNVLKRYGIDTAGLEQKKILFASEDMGRNFENNEVAVFDQYILATPLYINANRLFCNMIWQDVKNQEKREASDLIFPFVFNAFWEEEPEEILTEWSNSVARREGNLTVEDRERFYKLIREKNSERFVREIVQYSLNPEKFANDRAFLAAMEAIE